MKILNREVSLEIDYYGDFTLDSLKELERNQLVYIDSDSIYFFSQKDNSYIFLDNTNQSIDTLVIKALDEILDNEVITA